MRSAVILASHTSEFQFTKVQARKAAIHFGVRHSYTTATNIQGTQHTLLGNISYLHSQLLHATATSHICNPDGKRQ